MLKTKCRLPLPKEYIVMPLSRGLGLPACVSLLLNFVPNREASYSGLPWSAFLDSNICDLVVSPKTRTPIHYFEA